MEQLRPLEVIFWENIDKAMKDVGMKNYELSLLLGKSKNYISGQRRNKSLMSSEVRLTICEVLNVDWAYLCDDWGWEKVR
ncbi:Cro/C1-type HTH DNA-binding domain-containing protein [Pilibacter termitis]|uniref:Cro/C1-type HTH DNA-binding domain-containing protein n=1 Tax=Pilibacter termitis TaxID=263852 RepID=A0A1T4RDA9_9ENTE|nr:helix-turn-helix domain-containing protein [Pilibacter termitis]SKA13877.1 Cro/C1-type HTH DNA-binding domain-containing protein [Pilibacter termitis]